MNTKKWHKCIVIILVTCLSLIFTTQPYAKSSNPQDPLEPVNRVMFKFNDFIDTYFLKPVATVYNKIMPKPFAAGLSNFYANIDMIPTIFNDVFMGNFYQATSDTWRFAVNSTFGVLGIFDVASRIGLEPNSEDVGLTLARWGYKNSIYLVLPFYGPSTFRDALGFPVNYYGLSVYPYIHPTSAQYAWYFGGVVVRRADLLHYEGFMQQAAIDKYVFMRDAYLQHRNYLIERNKQLGNPYLHNNELEESTGSEIQAKTQEATRPFSSI